MADLDEIRNKKKEIDEQLKQIEEKDKSLGIYRAPRQRNYAGGDGSRRAAPPPQSQSSSHSNDLRSVLGKSGDAAMPVDETRVQSAVVPAGVGVRRFAGVNIQTEKPKPSLKVDDEASKKRNKRMFGSLLLGTLREAQKKETTTETETEKKRRETEEKIQKQIEAEQENSVEAKRRKLIRAKAELTQKASAIEMAKLDEKNALVIAPLSKFNKTQSQPHVYWRSRAEEARLGYTVTTTAAAAAAAANSNGDAATGVDSANNVDTTATAGGGENDASTTGADDTATTTTTTTTTTTMKKADENDDMKDHTTAAAATAATVAANGDTNDINLDL